MKVLICLLAILAIGISGSPSWHQQYCFFSEYSSVVQWKKDLCDWNLVASPHESVPQYPFSECGHDLILGGYNSGFAKNFCMYTNGSLPLPQHHKVKITFELWAIDSWDAVQWGPDKLKFKVDGYTVDVFERDQGDDNIGSDICGRTGSQNWNDDVWEKSYELDHCENDIDLSFITDFTEQSNNESWGIRNIKIYTDYYNPCPSGQWFDDFPGWEQCRDCYQGCAECSDYHTCEKCDNPHYSPANICQA